MFGKTAIALLTWTPKDEQLDFYGEFAKFRYNTYVVADNNEWCNQVKNIGQIQIDPSLCVKAGFKHLNPVITERIKCPASAWEKALYFFGVMCPHYDYVWFFEDDVFIPRHKTIIDMDSKFDHDLLCADKKINWDGETDSWEWYKSIPSDILPPPWGKSMVCATRLSKKLLSEISNFLFQNRDFSPMEYNSQIKKYLFIEYIINTIALRNNLNIASPEALSTVVWRHDWQVGDLNPNFVYHPIKDIALHGEYRAFIKDNYVS